MKRHEQFNVFDLDELMQSTEDLEQVSVDYRTTDGLYEGNSKERRHQAKLDRSKKKTSSQRG